MKNSFESLFSLVQNLTLKELKCINRFLRTFKSEQSELFILFTLIRKTSDVSDEKIKKKFERKVPSKSYVKTKHLLYKEIQKIISYCEKQKSSLHKWEEELYLIEFFFKKGIVREAYRRLRKLKEKLRLYEEFELLLKIVSLEHIYYPLLYTYIPDKHIMFEEGEEYSRILSRKWIYRKFYSRLYELMRKRNKKEMKKLYLLFQAQFPEIPSKYYSLQILHLHFLSTYQEQMAEDDKELQNTYEKLLEIIRQSRWLQEKSPLLLPMTLFLFLFFLSRIRKWEKIPVIYRKFTNIINQDSTLEYRVLFLRITLGITYRLGVKKDFSDIILHKAIALQETFSKSSFGPPFLDIALLLFLHKQYDKAIIYLDKHIKYAEIKEFIFIKIKLLILRLVFLYEANLWELLPYALQNVRRYIRKHSKPDIEEKAIMEFIARLSDSKSEKETLAIFREFYGRVQEEKALAKKLKGLFDLDIWLESKVKKKDFVKLKRERIPSSIRRELKELLRKGYELF